MPGAPSRHARTWADPAQAATYEQGRPGYPPALAAALVRRLGLRQGTRVVDVAAGTGKLTRVLTTTGCDVVAVEPMAGMRLQLRAAVPEAVVVAASAEHLPFDAGRMDAVTVAQAFHWFDVSVAAAELRRILGPGGRLAVVNNTRDHSIPWVARLRDILIRYERLAPRPEEAGGWWDALKARPDFQNWEQIELANEQRFESLEEFDARFASVSFAILLRPEDLRAMLAELRAAVAHLDPVVIPLRTVVRIGHRRP